MGVCGAYALCFYLGRGILRMPSACDVCLSPLYMQSSRARDPLQTTSLSDPSSILLVTTLPLLFTPERDPVGWVAWCELSRIPPPPPRLQLPPRSLVARWQEYNFFADLQGVVFHAYQCW